MINVNYRKGYNSGYSIAGTNIFSIIKTIDSNIFENSILNRGINIFVQIPPFNIPKNAYNIGFFYWETDSFPSSWVPYILKLDEFWSPCDLVTNNLIKIGFKGKVVNVPTPIVQKNKNEKISFKYKNGLVNDDLFVFYSIFHWNFRKGYDVLLEGYLREFCEEDVMLIVKTNSSRSVKKEFKSIIDNLKKSIGDKIYPKIFFSEGICDYDDILRIHSNSDCFVLPHRGEGWGIPIHEALNNYNPVITTKFGGITDYLSKENAYLVDYKKGKVRNMNWSPIYNDKIWAEPSIDSLMKNMRSAFQNKEEFYKKQILSKAVAKSLSYSVVSKIIKSRIRRISENIGLV